MPSETTIPGLKNKFKQIFGTTPVLIRAPGRINLIGEHTDYNDGFVLPAAIDKQMIFGVQANQRDAHHFVSNDLDENLKIPVHEICPAKKQWANYLIGVIAQLNKRGIDIPGVDCLFGGNIPIGAGLSSSAAMEIGFVIGLNALLGLGLSRLEMVQIAQKAEHEYAGVKCGIMDQFACQYGEKDKVIRLDCRSLKYDVFPLDLACHDIILCDTGVSHSLSSSAYNRRRQECRLGVEILRKYDADVLSLRDVSKKLLLAHKEALDPLVYKRCSYVVDENQRLLDACIALERGDVEQVGTLMYQTHEGLKNQYEVSCRELDLLVEIAGREKVTGARMMGGGFGGCTINLVKKDHSKYFIQEAVKVYKSQTGIDLKTYKVSVGKGAGIIG